MTHYLTNRNLLTFYKYLTLIAFLLLTGSCTKDNLETQDWKSQLHNLTDKDLINFSDNTAIEVGEIVGSFFDELTKDGFQEFLVRVEKFRQIHLNEDNKFSIDDIALFLSVDKISIVEYISAIQNFDYYIANPENKANIAIGLYKYAELEAAKVTRGAFSRLATWMGAKKCGFWMHAAKIADTTVSFGGAVAAVDVALVSGGIATPLAALAVGNAIDSYASTVEYATNCM